MRRLKNILYLVFLLSTPAFAQEIAPIMALTDHIKNIVFESVSSSPTTAYEALANEELAKKTESLDRQIEYYDFYKQTESPCELSSIKNSSVATSPKSNILPSEEFGLQFKRCNGLGQKRSMTKIAFLPEVEERESLSKLLLLEEYLKTETGVAELKKLYDKNFKLEQKSDRKKRIIYASIGLVLGATGDLYLNRSNPPICSQFSWYDCWCEWNTTSS